MWFAGIKEAAARFWRSYIVAEDPDFSVEQVRQQRIDEFTLFADLLEAMRGWDRERGELGGMRQA
jgi:hypothetical protein